MLTLSSGPLEVEVETTPFRFTVRYRGRRLLRDAGVWVAHGRANDYFVQLTEGVIPQEDLEPLEHAQVAEEVVRGEEEIELALTLSGLVDGDRLTGRFNKPRGRAMVA
jgi:hypothetical protein